MWARLLDAPYLSHTCPQSEKSQSGQGWISVAARTPSVFRYLAFAQIARSRPRRINCQDPPKSVAGLGGGTRSPLRVLADAYRSTRHGTDGLDRHGAQRIEFEAIRVSLVRVDWPATPQQTRSLLFGALTNRGMRSTAAPRFYWLGSPSTTARGRWRERGTRRKGYETAKSGRTSGRDSLIDRGRFPGGRA